MTYEATLNIEGTLPSLNEYIAAERRNKYIAAQMKKRTQEYIRWMIKQQLPHIHFREPVYMKYYWFERNRKRDKDNIAFARKFIQDALVEAGVLDGDGWAHILGFEDHFAVDKYRPHVSVEIKEMPF